MMYKLWKDESRTEYKLIRYSLEQWCALSKRQRSYIKMNTPYV